MSIRFDEENMIEFLKRKYTPTSQYYSWHSMEYAPGMYCACGKLVVQEILRSAQAEDISIEEYVHEYAQFYAMTDIYRPNWFTYLRNRKERHKINCEWRKSIRSKDKRRRNRTECRRKLNNFLNTKRTK